MITRRGKMNLKPGDIFAIKGSGVIGWLAIRLTQPRTDRFHFGIIWRRFNDDFLVLESISKGLALGKLSWYESKDIEFYRVKCAEDLRLDAPDGLIDWGRAWYDYFLIVKIFLGGLIAWLKILWKEHRLRKLRAEDIPYCRNSALICTEAVDVAYDSVGVNIIPEGIIPLPSAFKQAEIEGRLEKING